MPLIAIDARLLQESGIGTYLQNLVPRLVRCHPEATFHLLGGHDLTDFPWASLENVRLTRAESPIYSVREQLELTMKRPHDADLFWSPHYNVPIMRRGRQLVTIHDVLHLARPEYVKLPHRRAYARLMFRAAARSDAIIFDSRFTADEFRRVGGDTSSGGSVHEVIHPGVDESWFEVASEGRAHDRPYLLFVGNVKPHKNVRGLLRAFGMIRDRIPHDLVIVGRRTGFIHGDPGVLDEASAFRHRVRFTGWLDEGEVRRYMAGADALVFPSLYEGFGLPPLEAMAAGCPVITSDAASLPEVCGEAALYCDGARPATIAEAILRLLGDSGLRTELRARGRERARLFTWERCAELTWQVIARTI